MKHIKKKFLFEESIKKIDLEKDHKYIESKDLTNEIIKNLPKENNIIIETATRDKIFAFVHNNNGKQAFVPLPDLTLVYFDTAYNFNKMRAEKQKEMLNLLSDVNTFSEASAAMLYNYYGLSSSCIINLFTTIESFMNSLIPSNGKYERVTKKSTEIFNIQQIQLQMSFEEKIKNVVPFFHSKNFFQKQTAQNQLILNLKEIRDKIIHTKTDHTGEEAINIFKKLLNFKYTETFDAVRNYINYYKPNYIENCDCGDDF